MTKNEKAVIAFIAGWLYVHLVIFTTTKIDPCDFERPLEVFWPFDDGIVSCIYDISEFLVYGIAPIIAYLMYKILLNYGNK